MLGSNASAAIFLSLNAEAGVPDWIKVLPAGTITTVDGRGPYRATDLERIGSQSMQLAEGKLAIDENHSIDRLGEKGGPSPARGWITELQARDDGLYGKVEWTEAGKALVADRAYRGISPVIVHSAAGDIMHILRASLTNVANLRGMKSALHAEGESMDKLLQSLREALGLPADADEAAIIAACKAAKSGAAATQAALQSALAPIAKAAGLKDDAEASAVLNAVTTLATSAGQAAKPETIAALQAELTNVTTALNALQKSVATERATAFVDGAIKAGRVGVKPMRDHYIAQHAIDPARVETEINAMPVLGPSGAGALPPKPDKDGKIALNAEQMQVAKVLGIKPEDYAKTLAAEQESEAAA